MNKFVSYPTHLFPVYAKNNLYGGTSTFPDNFYSFYLTSLRVVRDNPNLIERIL